jgi:hypothetical protein
MLSSTSTINISWDVFFRSGNQACLAAFHLIGLPMAIRKDGSAQSLASPSALLAFSFFRCGKQACLAAK